MNTNIFNSWLCTRVIAHRGLYNESYPENSLGAFKNAVDNNYPVELDVRIIKDGTLIVLHDSNIKRGCGINKNACDLTKEDLKNCKLFNTEYCIPTFKEVLETINGKIPMVIEIKQEGKVGVLEEKIYEMLKEYKGEYVIESFNPASVGWFKKHAPTIIRGQLSAAFNDSKSFLKKHILKQLRMNFISSPQFIAYKYEDLPNKWANKCRQKGLPIITWTVKNEEEYKKAKQISDNLIFEKFIPKD